MKAACWYGSGDIRVETVPDPKILNPNDAIIRVTLTAICGSDLHYYHHGGFGTVRLREPMVLGHEVSAYVDALGEGVTGLERGQLVAVSPSRPCGTCRYCQEGMQNQCLNMRFYGSAMPFPHIQGAFREVLVCEAYQAHRLAEDLSVAEGAFAEPLDVPEQNLWHVRRSLAWRAANAAMHRYRSRETVGHPCSGTNRCFLGRIHGSGPALRGHAHTRSPLQ